MLRDLNPHLTCGLCKGYMVNASTITECMHTFCKSCIVKEFLKVAKCPECGISVNPTEPTKTLKADNQLQDIINKVVPGLAVGERKCRREFYRSRGQPEEDIIDAESAFMTPKKRAMYSQAGLPVYVMLQHERCHATSSIRIKRFPGHFTRFKSEVTIRHLKEFIRQRLSLGTTTPHFEDAKSQKEWERQRHLAIQNAPDVDIICGDYLLDDDVTLGLLVRIKHGFVQRAMLPLTYRFRGNLRRPTPPPPAPEQAHLALPAPEQQPCSSSHQTRSKSHFTCASNGKRKAVKRVVGGKKAVIKLTKSCNPGTSKPSDSGSKEPHHLYVPV